MEELVWKTFVVFLLLFFFFWVIFYTYQPVFMMDDDFVGPGQSSRGTDGDGTSQLSDKYLSDKGRTLIFLVSILIALGLSFLFYLIGSFYKSREEKRLKEEKKTTEIEIKYDFT